MSVLGGWCLRCCSILEKTTRHKIQIPVRQFARGLKPLRVTSKKPKVDSDADAFFERVDPKVLDEIYRSHDGNFEPEVNDLETAYLEYDRERSSLRVKTNREKMVRKHFAFTVKKELNLLTYAEKEKIRYLHESDPEQWNAEALSRSFPISEEGVTNIIKSSYRANSLEQIHTHDQQLIERLRKIKSGEIPLTDELKAKLRIRNQIPIQPGLGTFATTNFSVPKKPLGQFGKLVAMPKANSKVEKNSDRPRQHSNALEPYGHHEEERIQENEFRQLEINSNSPMTLSEFENKVKSGLEKNRITPTAEVDYLLHIKEKAALSELLKADDTQNEVELNKPAVDDYVHFGKVPKYKNYVSQEKVGLNVEKGQPYIYEPETGYQKPFANTSSADTITIPAGKRKPGSVYRVGDSYYDEDGEFLYRVI